MAAGATVVAAGVASGALEADGEAGVAVDAAGEVDDVGVVLATADLPAAWSAARRPNTASRPAPLVATAVVTRLRSRRARSRLRASSRGSPARPDGGLLGLPIHAMLAMHSRSRLSRA